MVLKYLIEFTKYFKILSGSKGYIIQLFLGFRFIVDSFLSLLSSFFSFNSL